MKKAFSLIFLSIIIVVLCGCTPKNKTAEDATTVKNTVSVTFPEGYTATEIARKLEENNVCPAKDFLAALNDSAYIMSLDYSFIPVLDNISQRAFILEGYIFPDTYEFYIGESAEKALSRFLDNTEKKLTEEIYMRCDEIGYSLDDVITLASVIQKEAGEKQQMHKVSSVFHNRLKSSHLPKLQSDVTRNYVKKVITPSEYINGDKKKYTELYDTYECEGLPAGAVCNPGMDAINAALYPDDTSYYYFVTDGEKNYYYAVTYKEHKANCRKCGLNG